MYYSLATKSPVLTIEIINNSSSNHHWINLDFLNQKVHDFPVKLVTNDWVEVPLTTTAAESNQVEKPITPVTVNNPIHLLKASSKLIGKAFLVMNEGLFNVSNPRTSFFKVANRCSSYFLPTAAITGQTIDQEAGEQLINNEVAAPSNDNQVGLNVVAANLPVQGIKIELSFSATLCTSIMFVEKNLMEFQDCHPNNQMVQDFMIWNRSESNLSFRIIPISLKINHEEQSLNQYLNDFVIKDADQQEHQSEEIIESHQVITVPSFAPKSLLVQIMPKVSNSSLLTAMCTTYLISSFLIAIGGWRIRISN
jgi:hypothetical protein